MRSGRILATMCVGALGLVMVVGCPAPIQLPPVDVPLPGSVSGGLALEANVAKTASGTVNVPSLGVTVANATLRLDPNAVTISPADSAKARQAQTGELNTAEVTVWVASPDQSETVCTEGEEYGPFTIEFDDEFVIQSIAPSQVTLSQNTVDLLNSGQISLCIEAVMSIDGTISIASLEIQVGITL